MLAIGHEGIEGHYVLVEILRRITCTISLAMIILCMLGHTI